MSNEDLAREIEGLKNQIYSIEEKIIKVNKISTSNFTNYEKNEKKIIEYEQKIKNISATVGSLKDTINSQVQEGGVGTTSASFNDDELKEVIAMSIPYDAISTYVDKKLKQSGNSESLNKGKKKGKKSFFKPFMILLFVGALLFGSFKIFDQKKIRPAVIKEGTEFYDFQKKTTYRLTKDKKVNGYLEEVNTSDGIKRFFITSEIENGKEIKYKYFIK